MTISRSIRATLGCTIDQDQVHQALISKIVFGGQVGEGDLSPLIDDVAKGDVIADAVGAAIYEFDNEGFDAVCEKIRENVESHIFDEARTTALAMLRLIAKSATKKAEAVA